MDTPLVSIIMGAYNEEKTIGACIDSIIAQSYYNWEFIICNDCSTDRTLDVIKNYQDPRIVVINNTHNLRLAASLNKCIKIAKGKYIARMDADDICKKDRIAKEVAFLENNLDYDVVGSWAEVTNGEQITEIRKGMEVPDINLLLHNTPFIHPTIMMRSEVYHELNGYTVSERTKRGQDWDLWFRFYAKGHKGYNLQEPLLVYLEDNNSYKKRTIKTAMGYTQTALYGFRLLNISIWKYYIAFKPIISCLIPQGIKKAFRNKRS